MRQMLLRIPAKLENLGNIRCFIEIAAAQSAFTPGEIQDLVQAVDEAVTNIIQHGYGGEEGEIEIETVPKQNGLLVILRDTAGNGTHANHNPWNSRRSGWIELPRCNHKSSRIIQFGLPADGYRFR